MTIWTEWDPLQEVIVGDCYSSNDIDHLLPKDSRSFLNKIFDETKEDLDNLANYLNKVFNVKVHRPNVNIINNELIFPNFTVNPMAPVIPRDQYLVYGKTIVQTYTSMPSRYIDSYNYYNIFKELFDEDYNWISMPPPLLNDLKESDNWWTVGKEIYIQRSHLLLWHTATMFKYGDKLLTNHQGPGTQSGLKWIKNVLGSEHIIYSDAEKNKGWGHIDGGMFSVSDDLIITVQENMVPSFLKNKKILSIDGLFEKIDFKNFAKDYNCTAGKYSKEWLEKWLNEWRGYAQDICFDTNVLVVDPHNIVFSNTQPKIFKMLEKEKINCHVCPLRHGLFWESGIHCVTLDIKRKGEKRSIIAI
jgi:hypothetical protein